MKRQVTVANRFFCLCVGVLVMALGLPAFGQQPTGAGQVQLPLEVYQQLLAASQADPRPAPTAYALGNTQLSLSVSGDDEAYAATVTASFRVRVLENEWTLVPVLPPATSVSAATASGQTMELVSTPQGMMWPINRAGTYEIVLSYRVAATRFAAGHTLSVPLPPAPGTELTATIPGTGLNVSVIPSASTTLADVGGNTRVTANLPAAGGAQITWRSAAFEGPVVSRAVYRGSVADESATWEAEYSVVLSSDEVATLELLSSDVALLGIDVDGADAPIAVNGPSFAVTLQGRGSHTVVVTFQVPVVGAQGQPRIDVRVPRVPVSRFELSLEGEKEVNVTPVASVTHTEGDGRTVAVVNVPMTDRVSFTWLEAVPEAVEAEVRANAVIYHAAHAEEGVLHVRATTEFDVTRGETSQFTLAVPTDVQINSITSEDGAVADWRPSPTGDPEVTVFLDRRVSGLFRFEVEYERLLGTGDTATAAFQLPLLSAQAVSRQRGMVALLANRELTLEPTREEALTRVGENQLPAGVRDAIDMTIAHTFRYFETLPVLEVQARVPERQMGRFDAQVDTLISLGDVTTTANATIDINVKQGRIMALQLSLPADVNFLSLSAPSLRSHEPTEDGDRQVIDVEFTQEMEGQFRLEVNYERIHMDPDAEVRAPLLRVEQAEVQQGRLAIEALSAVEVQPSTVENLSTLELTDLPQQLILRTTNPILMAFRYVQADPRPQLGLRITRHREIEVQAAIIDRADYRTLYTQDGFSVTTAHFLVRNSRQQFLRVRLPAGSEVWSATVNGQAESPALTNNGADDPRPEVLINIINSARGFPVELIYTTPVPPMGMLGSVEGELPAPDMVVTTSHWDVFLPDDRHYGEPESDLNVVVANIAVGHQDLEVAANRAVGGSVVDAPLAISVPTSGVQFSFEKLYANQSGVSVGFAIPYTSEKSAALGRALALLGAVLFWLGIVAAIRKVRRPGAVLQWSGAVIGLVLVIGSFVLFQAPLAGPAWTSVLALGLLVGLAAREPAKAWWAEKREAEKAARAERAERAAAAAAMPPPAPPVAEPLAPVAEPTAPEPTEDPDETSS